ncbi:hypothetical protein QQ045_002949 [Rhodiola kirilowii]
MKSLTSRSSLVSAYPIDATSKRRNSRYVTTRISCFSRSNGDVPKLEPFSRSKMDRIVSDPPLIQKSENELADYCSTLEGDPAYSCWRAYFELKDLEKKSPKHDVERLILQAGGVKSLIGCLHGISAIHKAKNMAVESPTQSKVDFRGHKPFPIPDGLPKTAEEIKEEESARMPDSSFTRMLRARGTYPAWYSPAPDHETD